MNKLLALLALTTVLAGGFLIMRDPGHVPLFDANVQRLAETERQGYCSGVTFWETQGEGNEAMAAECRASSTLPDTFDLAIVQRAFCSGVVAGGWGGDPVVDCLQVLEAQRYWPTFDGALTDAWGKAYPYPLEVFGPATGTGSRTGDREEAPRDGEVRP